MYDYTLHRGRKDFCHYCLQAFRTADILKCCINDCFKTVGKHRIKMLKKVICKIKNYERKIKSPFMIYADFESISIPQHRDNQNLEEAFIKKI